MALNKSNEYAGMLPPGMMDNTPKAVFAALLVSEYLNRQNILPDELAATIFGEWKTLYQNGIVPQRPPNRPKGSQP